MFYIVYYTLDWSVIKTDHRYLLNGTPITYDALLHVFYAMHNNGAPVNLHDV